MKQRNPRFGCPSIAEQINETFGTNIKKDVVRRVLLKYLRPYPGPKGPSLLTFFGHMKDNLWSADLFRCESILLKSHWVLLVMDQYPRRIVSFGIHSGVVNGPVLCRMFNQAISGSELPTYISTDHDPLFCYQRWLANLRILNIEEIKSIPFTPISHPFVERLIGTIRREYLGQIFFWNAVDLQRKLEGYKEYYNEYRVHSSLNGNPPSTICGKVTF